MEKGKSLCKGKRTSQPNSCKKVRGCKVATGTKRTFCRKAKNPKKNITQKKKPHKKRSEIARLKGYNKKQERELKNLGAL